MLELYHHGSSACAAKVRFVLGEKGLEWVGHYVDILKGEQFRPEMRRAAGAARREREFARLRFRERDEFAKRLRRNEVVDQDDMRARGDHAGAK